jgi:hypothetical protein
MITKFSKFNLNESKFNDNFWNWFGDSKIIKNNEPLICYHGTNEENFNVFDINKIGVHSNNLGHYGYGIYFSTDILEAKTYGDNIYKCYLKINKPFTGTTDEILAIKNAGMSNIDDLINKSIDFESFKNQFKYDKNIYNFIDDIEKYGMQYAWNKISKNKENLNLDLFNDISNLIEYTTLNPNVYEVPDYVLDELKNFKISPTINKDFKYNQSLHYITDLGNNSKEFTDIIKNMKYDGVWYGSELVVFNANQIKSISNDGSYDINDDNIYS